MRVPDRSIAEATVAVLSPARLQRRVPSLDIDRVQLLRALAADVRHDLVFDELAISLCGLK
jgi:hypothetical protein